MQQAHLNLSAEDTDIRLAQRVRIHIRIFPPSPGRIHIPLARIGRRLRCTRGIHARGGSHASEGNGVNANIRPVSQEWSRSAVAIEGVDTESKEKAAVPEGWGGDKLDDHVSYSRMLRFVLPTLGIWLASPTMSLVDAGVVGKCRGEGVLIEHPLWRCEYDYCFEIPRLAMPTPDYVNKIVIFVL